MAFTAQTLTAVSGTDGRVRNADTQKILAGISKWDLQQTATPLPYPHFESPTQANGLVVPYKLRGLGDYKVNITGWFNISADGTPVVASSNIVNGSYSTIDLINNKTGTQTGYQNVYGMWANVQTTTDVNNQVETFTATFEVSGPLPVWGVVT